MMELPQGPAEDQVPCPIGTRDLIQWVPGTRASGSQVPGADGHKVQCPVRWVSYHHLTFSRRYQVDLEAAG